MSKRIKMSQGDYEELTNSRDWCKLNGYTGMVQWYSEELAFQAKRHALPFDAVELREEDDRDFRRRDRDR